MSVSGYSLDASRLRLGPELSSTPVAGLSDTVLGTANRYYASAFNLPTDTGLYAVSGMSWKNGTVVAGSVIGHLEILDASPPVAAASITIGWTFQTTQAGASSIQRQSLGRWPVLPGGTLIAPSIVASSGTARFGTTAGASINRQRAIALTVNVANGNTAAWIADTVEPYLVVHFKPVLV